MSSMTHNEDENQSIETDRRSIQIIELVDKILIGLLQQHLISSRG